MKKAKLRGGWLEKPRSVGLHMGGRSEGRMASLEGESHKGKGGWQYWEKKQKGTKGGDSDRVERLPSRGMRGTLLWPRRERKNTKWVREQGT